MISSSFKLYGGACFCLHIGLEISKKIEDKISTRLKTTDTATEAFIQIHAIRKVMRTVLAVILVIGIVRKIISLAAGKEINSKEINSIQGKDFFTELTAEKQMKSHIPITDEKTRRLIKQIMTIFSIPMSRSYSNVLLVGPPGAGKTTLVRQLAWEIKNNKITFPTDLKNKLTGQRKVYMLDLTSLKAGTQWRGTLESNLIKMIEFINNNRGDIFFIDEMHSLNTDSSSPNSDRLSDKLKPFLEEGNRIITATTGREYVKYILSDGAFADRFEKIIVTPPTEQENFQLLMTNCREEFSKYRLNFTEDTLKYLLDKLKDYDGEFPRKAIKFLQRMTGKFVVEGREGEMTQSDVDDQLALTFKTEDLPYVKKELTDLEQRSASKQIL